MSKLIFTEEGSKPPAPSVGQVSMYVKTDEVLYIQDSAGVEIPLGSASAITSLTGEATATGPGAAAVTLSNSAVIGKVLTGFSAGPNSTVLATDTLLQAIQKLQAQVSGTSGTAVTSLTGDVIGTGPGATATTVVSVGGSSAANVHSAELAANAATSSNTSSTIVKRDASGNFSASTITSNLTGNVTGNVSGSSATFTGSLAGDVTGTQSATVVSTVGGSSASNVHSAELAANAATSANTASTIVKRDASGNFSAGTITAALSGNATTSTSFTGALAGDVTGNQGTTVVATVGGKTASDIAAATSTVDNATSANTASTLVERDASGNFAASVVTANLTGNVTGNVSGSSASFTGSLSGDVTGTQSATSISSTTVTGKLLTGYVTGTNTPIVATNSILTAFENLQAQVSGTSGTAITSLTGDVSATGPGAASATVNSVGGSSAANIHSAELAANAATSSNTASTIVKRDSSGNFSAGVITASLSGNATTSTTSTNFSGSLSGDVTGTQSSTSVVKIRGTSVSASAPTDAQLLVYNSTNTDYEPVSLSSDVSITHSGVATVNSVGGSSATNVHSAELAANAATSANTASTIVKRDASGNFTAGTVTVGSLSSTGTISGSNFSGSSSGTNTGDVTKTNTNSINLTLSGQNLSANLNLSADAADAGNILANTSIHSGGSPGLLVEIPYGTPVQIGTSNMSGSASSVALSDHVHALTAPVVLALTLTGYVTGTNTPITSSNTLLVAFENLQAQISAGASSAVTSLTGDVTGTGPGATATTIAVGTVTDTKASLANKPSIALVSTSNLTLSGLQTIDGVTTAANTLVLLTAQTAGAQNGPWQAQSGAWTRPTWYPSGGTTQSFQFITCFVRLGNTYQGSVWRQTTAAPITIDTTATTWVITPLALNSSTLSGIIPNANTTATSANTASTIVLRDASGNFSASTITASLSGNATTATTSTNFSGSLSGDVSGTQTTTSVDKIKGITVSGTAPTDAQLLIYRSGTTNYVPSTISGDASITDTGVLTVASVGGSSAANIHSAELAANAATNANTASTIVKRDASGNFSAGTITASLSGNATNVTGVVAIANGGTGLSTTPTDGQLLIGSTSGTNYVKSTLTAGSGITITNAGGSITIASSGSAAQVTKTANYTILSTDGTIFCDTSGGAFTLTLPDPSTIAGKIFRVIDTTGNFNTNNLTLARHASEKIEGLAASKILQTNWGWFQITTNATDWFVG